MKRIQMTHAQLSAACKAQADCVTELVFKCPMCDTLQTPADLIAAGAGADIDEVQGYAGFTCIGRFTGKGSPSQEKGKGHGCNWTLGGLFQTHKLEITTADGTTFPLMELATREEADAYRASRQGGVA